MTVGVGSRSACTRSEPHRRPTGAEPVSAGLGVANGGSAVAVERRVEQPADVCSSILGAAPVAVPYWVGAMPADPPVSSTVPPHPEHRLGFSTLAHASSGPGLVGTQLDHLVFTSLPRTPRAG